MMNRDENPAVTGHALACDAPARNLRDSLRGVRTAGVRRARSQFRGLKRLCLPPRDVSPRLAPNH